MQRVLVCFTSANGYAIALLLTAVMACRRARQVFKRVETSRSLWALRSSWRVSQAA